jgi:uncharacterized lipoprotein YmbA
MKQTILIAALLLLAGCGDVNASTATYTPIDSAGCAAQQRSQYSYAEWEAMSPLERGIAGAIAVEACTP